MPLNSGTYSITNIWSRNRAVLLNSDEKSGIVASIGGLTEAAGERWDVTLLQGDDDRYTIRNKRYCTYAGASYWAKSKENVECAETHREYVWRIKEVPAAEDCKSYMIVNISSAAELCWSLDSVELHCAVQLMPCAHNPRKFWRFELDGNSRASKTESTTFTIASSEPTDSLDVPISSPEDSVEHFSKLSLRDSLWKEMPSQSAELNVEIAVLVKRLNVGDPRNAILACTELRNICWTNDDARAAALKAGAIPQLITFISRGDIGLRIISVSTLWKICEHHQAARVARQEGAVRIVVRLLNDPAVQRPTSLQLSLLLSQLCLESNSACTDSLPAIPALVRLVASKDASLHAPAAKALLNINVIADAQKRSITERAVPALVNLIDFSDTKQEAEDDTLIYACGALRNICWRKDSARRAALEADAIPRLVFLLSHKNDPVKDMATSALKKICEYVPAACAAVHAVVLCLKPDGDPKVQKPKVDLLSHLCYKSELARLESPTAIPAIVRLIESDDTDIQAAAVKALLNINLLAAARSISVQNGALPPLVKLLGSDNITILTLTCRAIANVCFSNDPAQQAAERAGANRALKALCLHENNLVQTEANKALKIIR